LRAARGATVLSPAMPVSQPLSILAELSLNCDNNCRLSQVQAVVKQKMQGVAQFFIIVEYCPALRLG
jgi:hypothetical protein